MRREHLPMKTLFAGIVGITLGGLGCSDDGTVAKDGADGSGGVPVGGNGGMAPAATGGTPSSGGQGATGGVTTGGSPSQSTGGLPDAGGMPATGGMAVGTGGAITGGSGTAGMGGASVGGASSAGAGVGGASMGGASMGGAGTAGTATGGTGTGGSTGTGGAFTGTCTESQSAGKSVSGSGPHDVVIETNSEDGIRCGTIFRPADLGGAEKYPIFVWGEGGCSQNGLSNQAAMGEIASWGYFIVADGTPGGDACQGNQNGAPFLDYVTWAMAENDKPCSAYYQSLDTTKVAADGFSCGGLMSENVAGDPRFTAIGITSSGLMGPNNSLYESMHAPFKIMNGGSSDIAYENGLNDYEAISSRGIPIVYFSKTSAGHGGDLGQGRGDFNRVNLAWLNWQLKGDEGATGRAFLDGPTCEFCTDSGWDYMSANLN